MKSSKGNELNSYEMAQLHGGSGGGNESGNCGHMTTMGNNAVVSCWLSKDSVIEIDSGMPGEWCCADECDNKKWFADYCSEDPGSGDGDGGGSGSPGEGSGY